MYIDVCLMRFQVFYIHLNILCSSKQKFKKILDRYRIINIFHSKNSFFNEKLDI